VGKCEANHGQENLRAGRWGMWGHCYNMLHDLADIVQTVFIASCNYETD
jgi:hypothetical protein